MDIEPNRIDPFAKRIRRLRRQFARGIGGKASREVAFLINTAATATAEWERVMEDQTATANDRARAFNVARTARADMEAALAPARAHRTTGKPAVAYPSVQEIMRDAAARAGR